MIQIGSVVDGKYKVLSKIGQGGMSVVYLALNERANKTWAIKEVRKDGTQDFTTVKQGLIAETNILKSLSHRYLPSIVDVIDDDETFLIVMDYIEGKSLNIVLKESMEKDQLPISVENVITWGIQLCDVMYYLHTRTNPIIYRDLKPANVMLKPTGEISLIDFGTARVFKTGNSEDTTCLGTPGYAAPEQYGGNGQSCPQSDIYCLGATLHHLITGRNPAATPFNFPPITECRPTLLEETPRELRNTVLGLEMIIEKCTQYHPENRYENCAQLKYDLEHPEELGKPYRKKQRNKIILFGASAAISLIFGGISLGGMLMAKKTETTGYDYYLESAGISTGTEKLNNYQKAVDLNPSEEEAYLKILDSVEEDNQFTREEDAFIISVLNTRKEGRQRDNKSYFKDNESGYVNFSYRLGLIYYYSEGDGANKNSSIPWFENVTSTDMNKINLGENEENKQAMKARSEILGKISSYNNKIGQMNQAGDAEITYQDYWNDLMSLMDENIAGKDNVITELRLYKEIVYQICTNYDKFKESGLKQEEMEKALNHVEERIKGLEGQQDSSLAEEISQSIQQDISMGRKQIIAIFAPNVITDSDMEEGNV